ncbi:MAG: putative signal transducing protein [Thiohalomonadales bacterium]
MNLPDKKKPAVYSAADLFMVTHAANVLNNHGIETLIENNFLAGAVGELPVFECWPRLFVVVDSNYKKALAIITTQILAQKPSPNWLCSHCSEDNEGTFELCWSCGLDK